MLIQISNRIVLVFDLLLRGSTIFLLKQSELPPELISLCEQNQLCYLLRQQYFSDLAEAIIKMLSFFLDL